MSEPHTADLGTRYRYRREGAELERERIINAIESYRSEIPLDGMFDNIIGIDEVIALIKEEQK